MPKLTLPHARYKKSFLAAVREFQQEKLKNYAHLDRHWLATNFEQYIQQLMSEAKGIGLPAGYVPHTMYWLVAGAQFLGHVDIRHTLTPELADVGGHIGYAIRPTQRQKGYGTLQLQLALHEAKKLGITRVLITCDVANIGSAKIIEKNGGQLEKICTNSSGTEKKYYWVELG